MPLALIISSHVAASHVGGTAQASALTILQIDSMVLPTVLYGRHPGWGEPGGARVAQETLRGMLGGIEANGVLGQIDLILTDYFASPEQVSVAAMAIDRARDGRTGSEPVVIVDPTLGDGGKLYVPVEVAEAVIEELVPRADILAPNAWELSYLTGADIGTPSDALAAAHSLGKPVLVSSIDLGEDIGVIYADEIDAWIAVHPRAPSAPKGTGDLLTALFGAALLDGLNGSDALTRAVSGVAESVFAAQIASAAELPIIGMGQRLTTISPRVRLERLA